MSIVSQSSDQCKSQGEIVLCVDFGSQCYNKVKNSGGAFFVTVGVWGGCVRGE